MKKIISGLIYLSIGISVQGQVFRPQWAFGINGGIGFSIVDFPNVPQKIFNTVSAGLTVRYVSEEYFGIQVETNFFSNEYAKRLDYVELPVMTHFYQNLGEHIRFVFNVGSQIKYNICYDQEIYRKFDYGIVGSLGIELFARVVLEGRYYFGVSDIFSNYKNDVFQSPHNQAIIFKLSWLY